MAVRVLRVLEYVYADAEAAIADRGHWQIQGTYSPHRKLTIRSAVLDMETVFAEQPQEIPDVTDEVMSDVSPGA